MTTIDAKTLEYGEKAFPRIVNFLTSNHPLPSLVYHDYCYNTQEKNRYEGLLEDVLQCCCFTAINLLRLKMDLIISTRIAFDKAKLRRVELRKQIISFLSNTGVKLNGTDQSHWFPFLKEFFKVEREKIKNPEERFVLGVNLKKYDGTFIEGIRGLLFECYHACELPEKNFLREGDFKRFIGGKRSKNETEWFCGFDDDEEDFFMKRPNIRQFICTVPKTALFQFDDPANVDIEKFGLETTNYLDRIKEELPSLFHKTFCLTGVRNDLMFTFEGLKQGRTLEYGIPENCRNLGIEEQNFDKKVDLMTVNEIRVHEFLQFVLRESEPLQVRGPSPEKNPTKEKTPEKPKMYLPSEKPAVLQEFRPTRRVPKVIQQQDGFVYLGIGAFLIASVVMASR